MSLVDSIYKIQNNQLIHQATKAGNKGLMSRIRLNVVIPIFCRFKVHNETMCQTILEP